MTRVKPGHPVRADLSPPGLVLPATGSRRLAVGPGLPGSESRYDDPNAPQVWAVFGHPRSATTTSVAPGPIWTPLIPATMPQKKVEAFGRDTPLGRAGLPAELTPAYVLLGLGGPPAQNRHGVPFRPSRSGAATGLHDSCVHGYQSYVDLSKPLDRVEKVTALDTIAGVGQRVVRRLVPKGRVRDALHGVWLGHPLHPVLAQMPVGAFLSAAVLDALGSVRPARTLQAVGVVSAVPTAVAGLTDWSEQRPGSLRVGVLHAAGNVAGLSCYAGALALGSGRHQTMSRALSYCGLSLIGLSGAIGGHLAYRQAVGVNNARQLTYLVEPDWHDIGPIDRFSDSPVRTMLDEVPIVVGRGDAGWWALSDRCSHLAGSLAEGQVTGSGDAACVVCPLHGSTFRLYDGSIVHGPATAPQPVFEVRESVGRLLVRLAGSD